MAGYDRTILIGPYGLPIVPIAWMCQTRRVSHSRSHGPGAISWNAMWPGRSRATLDVRASREPLVL